MKFFNAVLFMIVFTATAFANPPGLQGKDYPRGLNMQNKTPPGWTHGKKEGWEQKNKYWKNHPAHPHPEIPRVK